MKNITFNRVRYESIARDLMNQHKLYDWKFTWDRGKRRLGLCNYRLKTISLSIYFMSQNPESVFMNTILHEIAHALTPGHGHNWIWKAVAMQLGCNGNRCADAKELTVPESTWIGHCPKCNNKFSRHRMTAKAMKVACKDCCEKYNFGKYSTDYKIVWKQSKSSVMVA